MSAEIESLQRRLADGRQRIAELEEANLILDSQHKQVVEYNHILKEKNRLFGKQRAALKKLGKAKRERGKALVDERARAIENNPNRTIEWTHYNAATRAREQLRVEGKL